MKTVGDFSTETLKKDKALREVFQVLKEKNFKPCS
jgi:hypothetical protein